MNVRLILIAMRAQLACVNRALSALEELAELRTERGEPQPPPVGSSVDDRGQQPPSAI
jgi:hypothetical protein